MTDASKPFTDTADAFAPWFDPRHPMNVVPRTRFCLDCRRRWYGEGPPACADEFCPFRSPLSPKQGGTDER